MGIKARHLRWVGSIAVAVVLLPVVGQWFIALADEMGLYHQPLERARSVIAALVESSPFHWTAGAVLGFTAGVWLDAIVRRTDRKPLPPLEMIFDDRNPNGRFWSGQTWTAKDGSHTVRGTEYRVELRNNTDTTMQGVILTSDVMTDVATEPGNSVFVRNRSETIDIHPKSSELAIVCLIDDEPDIDSTILLRARAKDTPEVSLRFAVKAAKLTVER